MRTLEKSDSPILTGYQLFHNYTRPHMALNGKTPAEAAGITVEGENKWVDFNSERRRKAYQPPSSEGFNAISELNSVYTFVGTS